MFDFKALKRLRLEKGFTQKQMASFAGVVERLYQKWEYGQVEPGAGKLLSLMIALDCSAKDLYANDLSDNQ